MGWADLAEGMASELGHVKWRLPCAPEQSVTCNGGGTEYCASFAEIMKGLHAHLNILVARRCLHKLDGPH
jgi:hypothetical protein